MEAENIMMSAANDHKDENDSGMLVDRSLKWSGLVEPLVMGLRIT